MPLQTIISLALALAALSCLLPFCTSEWNLWFMPYLSFTLSAASAVAAGYAFRRYGKKGWPAILGAPAALWWPYVTAGIYYACTVRHDCI